VEVALPWRSLEIANPRPGLKVPFNVSRTRRAETPAEYTQWAPTLRDFSEAKLFGSLLLE
jgi:hypothetical protein